MIRFGSYKGEEVVRAFQRAGWRIARQRSNHVIFEKEGYEATLSVPVHKGKNVKRGTLRDLIRDARMTVEQFLEFILTSFKVCEHMHPPSTFPYRTQRVSESLE